MALYLIHNVTSFLATSINSTLTIRCQISRHMKHVLYMQQEACVHACMCAGGGLAGGWADGRALLEPIVPSNSKFIDQQAE